MDKFKKVAEKVIDDQSTPAKPQLVDIVNMTKMLKVRKVNDKKSRIIIFRKKNSS